MKKRSEATQTLRVASI